MVEEGSHKEVVMGAYADWQMFMRLMKIVGVPLRRFCRSADGLTLKSKGGPCLSPSTKTQDKPGELGRPRLLRQHD
jgi:hypothetical protein